MCGIPVMLQSKMLFAVVLHYNGLNIDYFKNLSIYKLMMFLIWQLYLVTMQLPLCGNFSGSTY